MAFIGLKIPPETARLLSEIEVDGKREPPSSYHITLLFLGSDIPIEELAKALVATFHVTSRTRPFTVSTNRVTSFPSNDDGTPIICPVASDSLHDLQGRLRGAYDDAGVDYSKKYPEYKPHVTLSYADAAMKEKRIPTVEWGAHEVVLWGGDSGDNRVVMHFPMSLDTPSSPEMAERVARRYTAQLGKSRARRGATR